MFFFSFLLYAIFILIYSGCTKTVVHRRQSLTTNDPEKKEFFTCRINNVPYTPRGVGQATPGNCKYEFVYSGNSGWSFQLSADRYLTECRNFTVGITLDSVELREGRTYVLGTAGAQKNFGMYFLTTDCSPGKVELFTDDDKPGEITITKFDPDKGTVAGTFSFVVFDANGHAYRITNGIFERHFTN